MKSNRLEKRKLPRRPTDGAGGSRVEKKKAWLKLPVVRRTKVRGAARLSKTPAPAFPNRGVLLPPAGLVEATLTALQVSEMRYRRLFEAARDGVLLLDPGTRKITDVNPFMTELLGYTYEEFVGKELWEIGLLKDQTASRKMFRELREKHYVRYEDLPLKTIKGQTREVEVVANLYQEDKRPVIQCNIRDITDRKAIEERLRISERRYRRLFETAHDGILILDTETRKISDANPFMIKFLGYTHAEFVGKELWEIGLLQDQKASRKMFQELREKHYVRYDDLPLATKLGERRQVEFVSNRYQDNGLEVIQCNIRDIAESKQFEAELHQLSGHLLRLQDEERRRIGRELHTSTAQELTAVAMNLGLVQQEIAGRDVTADNQLADSQAILEQCQRELRTLTYQLHPPVLDEMGLAGAVSEYAKGYMQRSGINVTLDISPSLGRLPAETERALFRVVQEGLSNVHRHSGSPTATIRIGRKSLGVVLEVKDAGHGLPREMLIRGDGSVSKVGVGIAGMRERLCQLGGRFELESCGRGTTLRAIVPGATGREEKPCKS